LLLTLDESKNTHDEVFEINGITYVIDKYVHKKLSLINISFETKDGKSGFVVSGSRSD
jgi:Fe-S cluster assembly iron-binding protein IscA